MKSQTLGSVLHVLDLIFGIACGPLDSQLYPAPKTELHPTFSPRRRLNCIHTASGRTLAAEKMKNHILRGVLSLELGFLLAVPAHARSVPARIDVVVVAGDGVTDNIREKVTRDPVVRVEDDDHRPVDGATVTFALPVTGASGEFSDGAKALTVVTGKDGLATARGLKTNEIPGNLQIYVTASYQGLRGRALINQVVEVPPGTTFASPQIHSSKPGGKWKWVLLGVAAAGGAGAALYLSRHSTSTPSSPVTITSGTVVFGTP